MGHNGMLTRDSRFEIDKSCFAAALAAVRRADTGGYGDWIVRAIQECDTLLEMLEECGFDFELDDAGNVTALEWIDGSHWFAWEPIEECLPDITGLFQSLAPFVKPGSYLHWVRLYNQYDDDANKHEVYDEAIWEFDGRRFRQYVWNDDFYLPVGLGFEVFGQDHPRARGSVDGLCFYFREEGHWEFFVSLTSNEPFAVYGPEENTQGVFYRNGEWRYYLSGTRPTAANRTSHHAVERVVRQCAIRLRADRDGYKHILVSRAGDVTTVRLFPHFVYFPDMKYDLARLRDRESFAKLLLDLGSLWSWGEHEQAVLDAIRVDISIASGRLILTRPIAFDCFQSLPANRDIEMQADEDAALQAFAESAS